MFSRLYFQNYYAIVFNFKFDHVTHNVSELLNRVKITTLDRKRRSYIEHFPTSKTAMESIEIKTKYWNSLGKCYSVRPKKDVVRKGILSIAFTANMDVYIYLGYPGQLMYNTRTRVRKWYLSYEHLKCNFIIILLVYWLLNI